MRIFSKPSLIFCGSSGNEQDSDKDSSDNDGDGDEDDAAPAALCANTSIALRTVQEQHRLPCANGSLHSGHALNKILKHIVNRNKWSCRKKGALHARLGLPWLADRAQGYSVVTARQGTPRVNWRCRVSVNFFSGRRSSQTQKNRCSIRAGHHRNTESRVSAFRNHGRRSKQHTYRTLDPASEANQLQVFGQMARSGLIYRQYRPVYWSPSSKTDLAEAELEYNETHRSRSAYVRFKLDHIGPALREVLGGEVADVTVSISWSGLRLRGHCLQMRQSLCTAI
ncbi:hypothetical protein A4X13_0g8488 [Tilletia indica]|uniref:Aminoacyl-tRNA synthetase class Ia domain-containing protein n=1 Tax=Tilletia indica TaxID=43049 RepID=A0A8T8SEJ2_9BASI|nr:hypothetical protein A4X13_0g8488 [Tilletia indica]